MHSSNDERSSSSMSAKKVPTLCVRCCFNSGTCHGSSAIVLGRAYRVPTNYIPCVIQQKRAYSQVSVSGSKIRIQRETHLGRSVHERHFFVGMLLKLVNQAWVRDDDEPAVRHRNLEEARFVLILSFRQHSRKRRI